MFSEWKFVIGSIFLFLPPAAKDCGKVVFSVCLSFFSWGEGTCRLTQIYPLHHVIGLQDPQKGPARKKPTPAQHPQPNPTGPQPCKPPSSHIEVSGFGKNNLNIRCDHWTGKHLSYYHINVFSLNIITTKQTHTCNWQNKAMVLLFSIIFMFAVSVLIGHHW